MPNSKLKQSEGLESRLPKPKLSHLVRHILVGESLEDASKLAGVDRKTAFSISKKMKLFAFDDINGIIEKAVFKFDLNDADRWRVLLWMARERLPDKDLEALAFELADLALKRRRKRLLKKPKEGWTVSLKRRHGVNLD